MGRVQVSGLLRGSNGPNHYLVIGRRSYKCSTNIETPESPANFEVNSTHVIPIELDLEVGDTVQLFSQ